jgi:hypothetical protein
LVLPYSDTGAAVENSVLMPHVETPRGNGFNVSSANARFSTLRGRLESAEIE